MGVLVRLQVDVATKSRLCQVGSLELRIVYVAGCEDCQDDEEKDVRNGGQERRDCMDRLNGNGWHLGGVAE